MLTTSYIHIKNSSKFRIIIFIILSWCLPFFTWIPLIIGYRVFTGFKNKPGQCQVPDNKYLILVLSIILYHIPLICMVTFYTKLIVHIKKSSLNNLELNENLSFKNTSIYSQTKIKIKSNIHSNRNSLILGGTSNNNNGDNLIELNNGSSQNSLNLTRKQAQGLINSERKLILRASTAIKNRLSKSLPCGFGKTLNLNIPQKNTTNSSTIKTQTQNNSNKLSPIKNPTPATYRSYRVKGENFLNGALLSPKQPENLNLLSVKNSRKLSLNINYEKEIHRDKFLIERDFISDNTYGKNQNINESNGFKFLDKNSQVEYIRKCSIGSKRKEVMNGSIFAENSDYQNLRMKRNRKAARMLGFLVAAFSICWLPFTIFYPLSQFYPDLLPDYAQIIIWWMGYSNSTINPFLYVYSNKNIR